MKRLQLGQSVNSKPLTESHIETWDAINGVLNATGVYGYIDYNCNSKLFTATEYFPLNYEFGFKIPKRWKCNYFAGYTFAFSSCLQSCHNFINISLQINQTGVLEQICSIFKSSGFAIDDNEVLFTIKIPANLTGEDVWDFLNRVEEHCREATKSFVTLAGRPTYRSKTGQIIVDHRLVTFPDLRAEKRRKDLVKDSKVDFGLLQSLVGWEQVPCREAQPTNLIKLAPASGESFFSPSGEKITANNATAGVIVKSLDSIDTSSPLQVPCSGPSAPPTDHSAMSAQSGGHSRKIKPTSKQWCKLGDLQSLPYTVPTMCNNIFINLEMQLEGLFYRISNNQPRMQIGLMTNRGKKIPKWMSKDQFVLTAGSWLVAILTDEMVGKENVKQMFLGLTNKSGKNVGHCFKIQNWVLQFLKEKEIITIISNSYSNFDGNKFCKRYRCNVSKLDYN
jgi:hypothetical protein